MRLFVLAMALVACTSLVLTGDSFARVPDPTKCEVSDGELNTCPDPTTPHSAAERYIDLVVTLYNENYDPVEGFPAGNFTFTVLPHSGYPNLGGGPGGDCAGCEGHYSVYCLDAATNIDGEMNIRVDLGMDCAPSMCCPVEVWVDIPQGTITDPGAVLQNSVDMVGSGLVDLSDIAAFGVALTGWGIGTPQPCADFVYSVGQTQWGELDLSDISMFGTHIGHACTPFVDPCP